MSRRLFPALGVASAVALGACISSAGAVPSPATTRPAVHAGGGTVILGADLARGGNLLDALAGRVSSIRVSRRAGGGCPSVVMRGQKTLLGNPSAQVYVDDTPMQDTCILHQIRVLDVDRVEVYPGGAAGRSGHRADPNGSILVYLTGPDAMR